MGSVTIQPLRGRPLVRLRQELGLGRERMAAALGLAPKTLARAETGKGGSIPAVLDRLAALDHVLKTAGEVLGGRKSALAWLTRGHPHYEGTPPLQLLRSYAGTVELLRALERIAQGVMS